MAKRYIETSFFKSPFVRGLKGPLKLLYTFIICDCDGSGIWTPDFEISSVYTDFKISQSEFEKAFAGKFIDLKNGRYFFPDFIEHQYPTGLSLKNPAHSNFIKELKKYGLIDENLKVLKRPLEGSYVTVTVKETVEVMETVEVNTGPVKEFKKPPISEIESYLISKYPGGSFEGIKTFSKKFWSHYENNGWKVGKNKMKNWKLALVQWDATLQNLIFPNLPATPAPVSQNHKNIEIFDQMLNALENPQTSIQHGING